MKIFNKNKDTSIADESLSISNALKAEPKNWNIQTPEEIFRTDLRIIKLENIALRGDEINIVQGNVITHKIDIEALKQAINLAFQNGLVKKTDIDFLNKETKD